MPRGYGLATAEMCGPDGSGRVRILRGHGRGRFTRHTSDSCVEEFEMYSLTTTDVDVSLYDCRLHGHKWCPRANKILNAAQLLPALSGYRQRSEAQLWRNLLQELPPR